MCSLGLHIWRPCDDISLGDFTAWSDGRISVQLRKRKCADCEQFDVHARVTCGLCTVAEGIIHLVSRFFFSNPKHIAVASPRQSSMCHGIGRITGIQNFFFLTEDQIRRGCLEESEKSERGRAILMHVLLPVIYYFIPIKWR